MKKILRFSFKIFLGLIGFLILAFVVLKLVYNDDIPKGETGAQADALAYNILEAINHKAFIEAKEIHWVFRGVNHYEWQLQENVGEVSWEDYKVAYHTKKRDESKAFLNGQRLEGKVKNEAINYAVHNFNNDSFWLIAPHKLFDAGTTRSLVREDGKDKLLVQYTSGGTTPGDAYLWEVDEEYKPIAFKMWVSILPFDGLEAKWTDWEMTKASFPLPESRLIWGLEIPISEVKVIP
jgi:hypothetical protein